MTDATCRACGARLTKTLVDLGLSPLANAYLSAEQLNSGSRVYPLHVYYCDSCYLVQLEQYETPDEIFKDYLYFSSYSAEWLRHAKAYVEQMIGRFGIGRDSKVIEVASNDGYLLQYFVAAGVPVVGVEPAANVAAIANQKGVPTKAMFFGSETARQLKKEGHQADLMAANNVLAHVPDILDFTTGFAELLKPDAVATFEFPHVLNLLIKHQFDTIYHEHFSYLSLHVVEFILGKAEMRVFDVQQLATHGGSLRVFSCLKGARHQRSANVEALLQVERDARLHTSDAYANFQSAVIDIKCDTLDFMVQARRAGKRVLGYGAAAKGNTFLNFCGIGREFMPMVADRNPHKQGSNLPGTLIPVVSPQRLLDERPDYVFVLPWNLKDEVMEELKEIRSWGGKFVTAIPKLTVA